VLRKAKGKGANVCALTKDEQQDRVKKMIIHTVPDKPGSGSAYV